MKINKQVISSSLAKKVFQAKRQSPHIFFVGGVVGVVGSAVLACRATLKVEEALDEIKNDVALIKAKSIEQTKSDNEEITEIQKQTVAYTCTMYTGVKTVKVLGRLYGPAILLGGASIAALTGSHIQLTRRNAALTATLAVVTKAYDDYRERVRDEIGKEQELALYRGIEEKEVELNGKKTIVQVSDPLGRSPYSRIFDECSRCWEKDPEVNFIFLRIQQEYLNQKLTGYGFVFLNDVYDLLGFDRTTEGQIVGWLRNGDGDGYIDFGIYEAYNERFVKGIERSVILDFNVDGPIHDKI